MKAWIKEHRKLVLVFLVLVAATLVWAGAELSGQANKSSADAGSNSMDMEMATMDTVQPPKDEKKAKKAEAPNCDWQAERDIRKQIDANNEEYKGYADKAQSERNSAGVVSAPTKEKVLGLAQEYKGLNDDYAAMWDACNCKTRAGVARDAGNTRVSSADVLVADQIDDTKTDKLEADQQKLRTSRRAYVEEASKNDELSKQDKQNIRTNTLPKAQAVVQNATAYLSQIQSLVNQIQSAASMVSSGNVAGMASCAARSAASGDIELLTSVKTLLALATSLLGNAEDLQADVEMISQ